MTLAIGGRRLCGEGRVKGGWYLECAPQERGMPLDSFLVDIPTLVPATLTIQALGVKLWRDAQGVTHVVDLVGEQHYPFVPDFWEEARVMGFSRKVSPSLPLAQLGPQSRFLFAHNRGLILNGEELEGHLSAPHVCPTRKGHGAHEGCTGLHWQVTPEATPGTLTRYLGQGEYQLRGQLRSGAPEPRYARAIFASVPITAITHIVDAQGVQPANRAALAAAQRSGVPVHTVGA